jgi:hypothetical protein
MLRLAIHAAWKFDPGRHHTFNAAVQLCLQRSFDPIVEYLDALQWDGTERLDTWMMTYLGAEDTKLNRAIGRLALVAMVRRVRKPGCRFDQIIVLESPEGRLKSRHPGRRQRKFLRSNHNFMQAADGVIMCTKATSTCSANRSTVKAAGPRGP